MLDFESLRKGKIRLDFNSGCYPDSARDCRDGLKDLYDLFCLRNGLEKDNSTAVISWLDGTTEIIKYVELIGNKIIIEMFYEFLLKIAKEPNLDLLTRKERVDVEKVFNWLSDEYARTVNIELHYGSFKWEKSDEKLGIKEPKRN